jgi:hypothetical protein
MDSLTDNDQISHLDIVDTLLAVVDEAPRRSGGSSRRAFEVSGWRR